FVILCPWILPFGVPTKPVALDFPQGSTLYVTAEPLTTDPTKYVRIGCERIADLSADYYKTSSGTGILEFNYRFEVVEVGKVDLEVEGYGGCISVIGVDIR
ncbi:hypothetical protein KAU55_00170, partial [Candidatus Bathyarchaeota archaeon]|nr:hypothetical protein [Candidatus Bathyarchaeota archaeon]